MTARIGAREESGLSDPNEWSRATMKHHFEQRHRQDYFVLCLEAADALHEKLVDRVQTVHDKSGSILENPH